MIITIASYKGGVSKTISTMHIAGYLYEQKGATLVIDGDPNRSAIKWKERGLNQKTRAFQGLPFEVVSPLQAAKVSQGCKHFIIDTKAREEEEFKELVLDCDLVIMPAFPNALALDPLMQTVALLRRLGVQHYKALLTKVPQGERRTEGADARELLNANGIPVFTSEIRETSVFDKASNMGRLLHQVPGYKKHEAWQDYCKVGEEILRG